MAGLTPAERDLLAEVRNREWVHRSDRPDRGGGDGDPPRGNPDRGSESPWRQPGLLIVLALIVVSWLGWVVAYESRGRIAYEEGRRDAAMALADEREELEDVREEVRERLEYEQSALRNTLERAVASFARNLSAGEFRYAAYDLHFFSLAEGLARETPVSLDHLYDLLRDALLRYRADS